MPANTGQVLRAPLFKLSGFTRGSCVFDRCARGATGERVGNGNARIVVRGGRLRINFLRIWEWSVSGRRTTGTRVTRVLCYYTYIARKEFYREFGWHEYRLLIGKVIKRCRGSDYRARGNYRKGKEACAMCADLRRSEVRARDRRFTVIFYVLPRRLSPRWIAEMEFGPAIFYVAR